MKIKNIAMILLILLQSNYLKQNFTIQEDKFIYNNGNQKIIIETINNRNYLQKGQKEKIKLKFENINPEKLSFSGKGISFCKTNEGIKNELFLNIDLSNNELEISKKYELIIHYHDGDINFSSKFIIPIKIKE